MRAAYEYPEEAMLNGLKTFVFRGNVIDLVVAVVVGAALTALVGAFSRALIVLAVTLGVIYLVFVAPVNRMRAGMARAEADVDRTPDDVRLLAEIRDLLRERQAP